MKTLPLFLALVCVNLLVPPLASAQSSDKMPRIAWLNPGSVASHGTLYEAFKQGLREHGYIEGQNIVIEQRWVEGKFDRLPAAAAELVRWKPDVVVAAGANAIQATKAATTTIPIVMATMNNPVGIGFIASFARPGGNITGMSNQSEDLMQKMLELLKAVVPMAARIGVLGNPANPINAGNWRETQAAAKALGVRIDLGEARRPDEIEAAFAAIAKQRPEAVLVMVDAMLVNQRKRVADLAARYRLPTMYPFREFVEVGGLMSYGASLQDNYRRAATYVAKILKGANPGDLPVEQPTKFELVINLKTAQTLGLTVPPELLVRADEIIR